MSPSEASSEIDATWRGDYGFPEPTACLGAWQNDNLLGAVLVTVNPPWDDVPPGPFIVDLFVIPTARRKGIGAALVESARAAVAGDVRLRVDDSAVDARRLYDTLGFTLT